MDGKTKVLIALGASTAANCIPCFEYWFNKANRVGLTNEEIQEAVDVSMQVKNGAQITIKKFINDTLGKEVEYAQACCTESGPACCA